MVLKNKNHGKDLYKNMIKAQDKYREAYTALSTNITNYFHQYIDDETSRVILDEYNFVIVRVSEKLLDSIVEEFEENFDTSLIWFKTETVNDYSNKEATNVTVFEYGFVSNQLR